METLEFRPPQFSEELAWLPGWVQHQVEQFDECIDEPLGSSKLKSKVSAPFQGNISMGNEVVLLSKEDGRHNSHHLFLSGEDHSSSIFTSSSRNLLQFHLHLSSDGFSQCIPSQFLASDASQTLIEPKKVLSMHNFENPVALEENTWSKTSFNADGLNILPRSSNPEPCLNYPGNSKDSLRHCGEKCSFVRLKDAEINDAVKLSVAASEALVIHDLVKSESDLEALDTADALEVSLLMKQARLEWLGDALSFSTEETGENDSLSSLDDFAMRDAFEDAGLICSPFDQHVSDLAISRVKETPASESHDKCRNASGCIGLSARQVNFDDIFTQKKSEDILNSDTVLRKDLRLDSLNCERQKKFSDNPVSSSSATNMVKETDPSTQKDPLTMDMARIVGSAADNLTSSKPQINEDISTLDSSLQNKRGDAATYPVSERFKSRWLGGWTTKVEVNASPQSKQNNAKSILKAFTCETSFFSESADIAPDENSLVQIPKVKSQGESQSSRVIEGFLDKASMEIFLSQDVVRSSSLSLVDPLCSVVPCSISPEDTNSTEAQHHNNMETDFERACRPTIELEIGKSTKISCLDVECQHGDRQVMHIVNKCSEGAVRKHMTSLKTYSMLLPNRAAIPDVGSLHNSQSFRPQFSWRYFALNQDTNCIKTSDKCSSKQIPFFTSVSKCLSGRESEAFCETMVNKNPIGKVQRQNASNPETARDEGDLPVHSPRQRMQPHLLNPRVRHRLQASKPSIVNSCRGEYSKDASGVEDVIRLQQSEKPQKIQSVCKNSHDRHVPAGKRVHFFEAEGQMKPNTNTQELHSSRRICSSMVASKKLKHIDKWSDNQICEESFLKCCSSIGKGCILQGMQFLLTGLSTQKGKDIRGQIQKHGGVVLSHIPSPSNVRGNRFSRSNWYQLPIILSSKKQRTAKFLYGCAVNAFILHVDWLTYSIGAGSLLPPKKYLILPWQKAKNGSIVKQVHDDNNNGIFEKVGIMLHGKHSFCTKLAKIVKHGDGQVFKTLQCLVQSLNKEKISVGAIVTGDENTASRHLRQCACEWQIPMMPASWIIKSLYAGKLLPFTE